MSVAAPTIVVFGRIVLNFHFQIVSKMLKVSGVFNPVLWTRNLWTLTYTELISRQPDAIKMENSHERPEPTNERRRSVDSGRNGQRNRYRFRNSGGADLPARKIMNWGYQLRLPACCGKRPMCWSVLGPDLKCSICDGATWIFTMIAPNQVPG